jgi:hypothetical protein
MILAPSTFIAEGGENTRRGHEVNGEDGRGDEETRKGQDACKDTTLQEAHAILFATDI